MLRIIMNKKFYKFTGWVVEIGDDNFVGHMKDLTNPENPDAIIEFDTSALSKRELKFLEVGAMLDFYVRYYDENSNQKPHSTIKFNKTIQTKEEIDTAKQKARILYKEIFSE